MTITSHTETIPIWRDKTAKMEDTTSSSLASSTIQMMATIFPASATWPSDDFASQKNLYVANRHWWWWPQPGQNVPMPY